MTDDPWSPEHRSEPASGIPRPAPPEGIGAPPQLPAPPSGIGAPPQLPAPPVPMGPPLGTPPPQLPLPSQQPVRDSAATASNPKDPNGRRKVVYWLLGAAAILGLLAVFAVNSGGSANEPASGSNADDLNSDSDPELDGSDDDDESADSSFFSDLVRPDSVAVDASSVWVSDAACGVVIQVDKATEEVLGAVTVGDSAAGVAIAGGSVWVGTRDEGSVIRIDPTRRAVAGSVSVPGVALGLTSSGNDLWATDPDDGVVYRINAGRSELVDTIEVGANPHHVAIGDRNVWVTNQASDSVTLIDTGRGGSTVDVPVGSLPLHVELGGGSVWVTDSDDSAVRRLDERTGELQAVIEVGVWPHALAFANGAMWVGTETGSFWRVDPATNTAAQVDDAEFSSIDTAVDGTDIWVADSRGGSVVRFDTASGSVGSVIDLNQLGDCRTFREQGLDLPPNAQL